MTYFSQSPQAALIPSQAEQMPSSGQLDPAPTGEGPDWRDLARMMLAALADAPRASWAFVEHVRLRVTEDNPDRQPVADEAATGSQTPDTAEDQAEVDAMIDRMEEELDGSAAPTSPSLDPWQARTTTYRPRAAALLGVMRLAKTFGTIEAFAEGMTSPASLTVLCTNAPQLDKIVVKLLSRLITDADSLCKTSADTFVVAAADAVRSSDDAAGQMFAGLSDGTRNSLEKGSPIVIVAPTQAILQPSLKALSPQLVPLAPLDHDMLLAMLEHAYPGSNVDGDVLGDLLKGANLLRLNVDDLTLSFRAPVPAAALKFITARIAPVSKDGPGLADFPLPAEVRAPVEQLVGDLRAWQAGEIPWRDVARGLLLVGPPGSGKTEIPRLIAREAAVTVIAGSVAQWSADGSRSSEMIKAMRSAFSRAAAQAPALLFIDELDAFGDRARTSDHNSSYTDYIVTALLDFLDGFHGHEGVVVMGATNHLAKVDTAIRRPGRFDTVVTLGYPDHDLMPAAIRWQLSGDLTDADLSGVAIAAVGMSGADVAGMVRAARALARKDRRPLTVEDLSAAVAAIRPPLPAEFHWPIAVHEAGHAIVGTATGLSRPESLAILPFGGVCAQIDETIIGHRSEIESMLAIDLAGRAAERLVLGQVCRGAGGPSTSDLARATQTAAAIELSWGLGASPVWLAPPEVAMAQMRLDPALRTRVGEHLQRAEAQATRILQANRPLLEEMAAALVERKLIAGTALDELTARVTMVVSNNEVSETAEAAQSSTAEANPSKVLGCVPQADSFRDDSGLQEREGPA